MGDTEIPTSPLPRRGGDSKVLGAGRGARGPGFPISNRQNRPWERVAGLKNKAAEFLKYENTQRKLLPLSITINGFRVFRNTGGTAVVRFCGTVQRGSSYLSLSIYLLLLQ